MKIQSMAVPMVTGMLLAAGMVGAETILRVGDPAPALAPGKWLKGEPVKSFEAGKVYVVEFWATWCMPCRKSIPHLSKLQAKYKDAVIIGQNCWESDPARVGEFVATMGGQMNYRVALDDTTTDKNGVMAKTWMVAAGQRGIPCAFVVDQKGKVVWTGFPTRLDQVLPKVLDGTFDAKKQAEREQLTDQEWKEFSAAQTGKDGEKALRALDELAKLGENESELALSRLRVLAAIKKDFAASKALAEKLADGLFADDAGQLLEVALVFVEGEKPAPDSLKFAEHILERAAKLNEKGDMHFAILHQQARVWAGQGMYEKAIEAETEVVGQLQGNEKRRVERTLQKYKDAARQIVIGPQATELEQLAAKELQRYLWQVTGTFLEIKDGGQLMPGSFLIGQRATNTLIEKLVAVDPGPQGYVLKSTSGGVVIAGGDAVGCLYGVYGLLEDYFGLTFGFAGDVLPDEKKSLDLPALDERHAPSVAIRGVLPWSIFPQTTNHSWADWKAIIDQMAKMRLNLLMIHNYNGDSHGVNEIYHNFPIDGKLPRVGNGHAKGGYMIGGPAWNPWEYRFKGRDLIDDCDYGAEAMTHGESLSNEELFARGVTMFQRVITYAHTRGVKIALGTDVNLTLKGNAERADGITRGKMAAEPALVKARIGQVIRDYPELDYFIAFCWEGMPKTAETLPVWEGIVKLIRQELKAKAPNIGLAVSSWGLPPEFVAGLPEDVICAPIAGYSARPQDGNIFGSRDFWACPWMEKDCDSCMFYYPFRLDLSDTIDAWQKRSPNTKGLYALTWRLTDAIDAKLWYIAHAPWDAQNKLKTSRDAYHAYAVANYGRDAAEAVTPIINQNEAFAANICEMGGPRPFREFATIMHSWQVVTFKGFGWLMPDGSTRRIEGVRYDWNNGGKKQKVGTPDSYVSELSSGLWLQYRNVDFGAGIDQIEIQAATDRGARVEMRLRDADGPVLGQAVIPKTKGWENFHTITMPITHLTGTQTVCIAFSDEVYPRKELVKAEQQLAVVDACMAKAAPGQRQRLDLLRTRLAAVRDHIRLNLEFPEYKLEDLPGAMESWVMNYIRRVDDNSSLGTMTSIEGRYVQHTYLREKVVPCYANQPLRPPLDVEARGTPKGAQIMWRDTDSPEKVSGYRVYRDGQLLTKLDLPATQDKFTDQGSGEFTYTVTAVTAAGKESLPSVKTRCLAGNADKESPFIVMVSPPLSVTLGQPAHIKARVIDNRSYENISATLHYRPFGSHDWQSLPMTRRVRAIFTATLTPVTGVEYYIEASDGSNTSRYPLAAPNRNLSLIVCPAEAKPKLSPPKVVARNGGLSWPEISQAHWYRIYRGRTPEFTAGPDSYLTYVAKGTTTFKDLEEDFDGCEREGAYYYRLTTMDARGFESAASPAVRVMSATVLKPSQAALAGGVQLRACAQASGGQVTTAFAKAGDQILFKGALAGSGLRIRYSNGNSTPTRCGLYVDGRRVATLAFPVTYSQSADTANYANGVRLANSGAAVAGDWNTFAVLDVSQPVVSKVALRIDAEDATANQNANCCNLDRLELIPAGE